MNFQEIKDEYYEKLVASVIHNFPELENEISVEDSPHYAVDRLFHFFMNNLSNKEVLKRVLSFLNESLELGKHETEDVIVIEIFSPIYHDLVLTDFFMKELRNKALDIFLKYSQTN